ncbi:DUF6252 family protein [Mucilaginibacter sp. OK098]|uniref:DUF6252 family protein n=1 Tax=Mucilaginibacter sp. OK098 TaxID=1855297 RepID=UPI0009200553|nr:DUF6252 family protein [Mucilaginibacter sp. OK098]SHM69396.1 hypothetical protein SAMN05216524_10378 [Mucilaginibacter sp. OK098]
MKKILILVSFAICITLIYSCHKDSKLVPADYSFTASKNGVDWGAQGNTSSIQGDSLRLTALTATGDEQFYINIKFNGNGVYQLTGKQAAFFTAVGSLATSYKLDFTRNSSITIKSYSTQTHIISGTFELNLIKDSNNPNEYVPLQFNNGIFRVKLPD